jgi:hypothetical protein
MFAELAGYVAPKRKAIEHAAMIGDGCAAAISVRLVAPADERL